MPEDVEDGSAASPNTPQRSPRTGLLVGCALLTLSGIALYSARNPIADTLVADQLRDRDVQASYRIEAIGPRTQRLSNVIIGDPRRPDLTARSVELDLRWTWQGPEVAAVRAQGVRLRAAWRDGRIRLGEVDKLLPPPSAEPFAFPDLTLALSDARASIATPWADVGARLDGEGALQRDFTGTLALVTRRIAAGGCNAGRTSAFGTIRLVDAAPRFVGPVRSAAIDCPSSKARIARMNAQINAALTADFARWNGRADVAASGLAGPGVRLRALTANGGFKGSRAKTDFTFAATGQRLQLAELTARAVSAGGTATLGAGEPIAKAKLTISGGSLTEAQRRAFAAIQGGGPLAPIVAQVSGALGRAAQDFDGDVEIALAGSSRTRRIELIAPSLRSASGARMRAEPGSRAALLIGGPAPMVLVDGIWTVGGGGLPEARLQIARSTSGQVTGTLAMAPLVAGSTRLALEPVRISGDRSGRMRLVTRARLSAPVAGGRVDGLGLAIDAVVAPTGAVQLAGGCQVVTLTGAALAGVRLGANRVQMCSPAGASLLSYDRSGLRGELLFPAPVLVGTSGSSPLRVGAAQGRYALASGKWVVDALTVALGRADAMTRFTAASLIGTVADGGMTGQVVGGAGNIGTVPLAMTDIAGDWQLANNVLTMTGGLVVSDRQVQWRFNPLVSKDAALRFVDGRITASASFAERETGTAVGRTELRHDFADAGGAADLIVPAMRFNDAFQPDQLTPLALGVIANAQGTLAGRGRIDWRGDQVTSSGTFTTAGSDFAAAFGSVNGASTTLIFDDLLGVRSAPGQRISFDQINPGFPVIGGTIDYQLLDSTNIRIEGGRWPFAGGELILKPTILDFDKDAVRRLEFELRGVDAAIFLTELGFENISASGIFDGVLPVEFSGLGGQIVGGRLVARSGGGHVAYVGELSNYNLGTMANFAFNMLKSLRYQAMEISLNGDLDGEMLTDVKITGLSQGEGASRNLVTRQLEKLPIEFNVKINAPFRQLISSAKSLYDPSVLIDQNLFQLIEAQRARQRTPVQPSESETVP